MENIKGDLTNIIKGLSLEEDIFKGNFGLEKECNRVNEKGELALTKHPTAFRGKHMNPYITTDFSESQIEMITPVCDDVEGCYDFLENIYNVVALELENEYLWPQSVPPILPDEKDIPIAVFDQSEKGKKARVYREHLAEKYGKKKQLISGIHYNFSFDNAVLKTIYNAIDEKGTYKAFTNAVYLRVCRGFIRYAWLFNYLFGSSVGTHETFNKACISHMKKTEKGDPYFEGSTSMRNGICGYRNLNNYIVSYESVEAYTQEINKLINDNKIKNPMEYYSPVRLKTAPSNDFLKSIQDEGIEYLELRILDVNPLVKNGISKETLRFVHLFLVFCLLKTEEDKWQEIDQVSQYNYELAATSGRVEGLKLKYKEDQEVSLQKWGNEVLDEMTKMVHALGVKEENYLKLIEAERDKINDSSKTPSARVLAGIKEETYVGFHMKKAIQYAKMSAENAYGLVGLEKLELSTQILLKDAIKRGLKFEIIDPTENFIVLDNGHRREYVKQATKTSLDAYITFLIMENKVVTKKVLEDKGIIVPKGEVYNDEKQAIKDYKKYSSKKIVIKPKSTNFGIGITILTHQFTEKEYSNAIRFAFSHDETVLVEEFAEGKEYRLFVINDEVVGILHRVPAHVVGDGVNNISTLVEEKNKNPLRGKGYVKPLEKIKLGEIEKGFLEGQGLDVHYVPDNEEIVYLRENSNISTGGDSIDFTDDVHEKYKAIAVKAAKAVGAKICGVDMLIPDIYDYKEEGYCIIELNFNPAIHIHCYPFKGENRHLGDKVLDALDL